MKKISCVSWCLIVGMMNLITWVLFTIVNVTEHQTLDTIWYILSVYMLLVHNIVLGIVYLSLDEKICKIFNMTKAKSILCTLLTWCISDVVFGLSTIILHEIEVIPNAGIYFAGLEYIIYIFAVPIEMIITVGVGKAFSISNEARLSRKIIQKKITTDRVAVSENRDDKDKFISDIDKEDIEKIKNKLDSVSETQKTEIIDSDVDTSVSTTMDILIYTFKMIFQVFVFQLITWIPFSVIYYFMNIDKVAMLLVPSIIPLIIGFVIPLNTVRISKKLIAGSLWLLESYSMGFVFLFFFSNYIDALDALSILSVAVLPIISYIIKSIFSYFMNKSKTMLINKTNVL